MVNVPFATTLIPCRLFSEMHRTVLCTRSRVFSIQFLVLSVPSFYFFYILYWTSFDFLLVMETIPSCHLYSACRISRRIMSRKFENSTIPIFNGDRDVKFLQSDILFENLFVLYMAKSISDVGCLFCYVFLHTSLDIALLALQTRVLKIIFLNFISTKSFSLFIKKLWKSYIVRVFIVNIIVVNVYHTLHLINAVSFAVCFLAFCFSWRLLKALGINAFILSVVETS